MTATAAAATAAAAGGALTGSDKAWALGLGVLGLACMMALTVASEWWAGRGSRWPRR